MTSLQVIGPWMSHPELPEVAIFRQNMLQILATFPANLQNFWAIFRQIAEVWAIPLPKF